MANEDLKNVVPRQDQQTDVTTKPDDELTYAEFVDKHSLSGGGLHDMNNDQIAEALGESTATVVAIQQELGHKLPEGAN